MLMTITVPSPVDRVNSSAWVKKFKDEIGEADKADPTIFEDADDNARDAAAPANERSSSGESAIAFLAEAALNDAFASRGSSFASMMGVSIGTISLETDPILSASTPLGKPTALSGRRASTIELLKKMGILESTILSTDALVRESLLGDAPNKKPINAKSGRKRPTPANSPASGADEKDDTVNVKDIREWDILSGRGGKTNHHTGNKRFRQVVAEMKAKYKTTDVKTDKTALSKAIVDYVNGYGGRFLKRVSGQAEYQVMTKPQSRKKTSQALRENKELKWKL